VRVAAAAADLIIHAGDLTAASMLEQLRGIGEVAAVHGNADDAAVRSLLPTRLELTVGDVRLGIVHDAGAARGRLERLRRSFTEANAVIFGEPLGGLCDGEQSALAEPVAVAGRLWSWRSLMMLRAVNRPLIPSVSARDPKPRAEPDRGLGALRRRHGTRGGRVETAAPASPKRSPLQSSAPPDAIVGGTGDDVPDPGELFQALPGMATG